MSAELEQSETIAITSARQRYANLNYRTIEKGFRRVSASTLKVGDQVILTDDGRISEVVDLQLLDSRDGTKWRRYYALKSRPLDPADAPAVTENLSVQSKLMVRRGTPFLGG